MVIALPPEKGAIFIAPTHSAYHRKSVYVNINMAVDIRILLAHDFSLPQDREAVPYKSEFVDF
jgi:hypothetical protein